MLGKAIQRYRKLNRYTQKQLGEKLGMLQVTISNIEHGLRPVKVDELEKFAEVFGCKATDLLISSQIHAVHEKERTSVDEESIPSTRLDTERKTGI